MILVTGATGLVGFNLLLQLRQENMPVKALFRSDKKLAYVKKLFANYNETDWFNNIIWLKTDILNIPDLEIAFAGVNKVYHCAAMVSFEPKNVKLLEKNNIDGTANVVNMCLSFNVEKLCYVSSIATLGSGNAQNRLINEETEWNAELPHSDYAFTKFGAEMEVWRGQQEGLNVVIVNPGVIFGNNFKNHGSSLILKQIKNGLRFYTTGKLGIVAVEDVVKCLILLMNSPIFGERFLLVAEDKTYQDLFTILANGFNKKAPKTRIKSWLTKILWKLDWVKANLFFMKRSLTKSTAKSLHNKDIHDNSKIKNTVNFKFTNMNEYLSNLAKNFDKND